MGKTVAFALYLIAAVGMTWPVAAGAARRLPNDLGDPVFVTFVIAWGSEHWLALLSGDLTAAARFWTAPIFHPETLTTAYSEHFALHSLMTLPVYAVTRNAILCYNLSFLAAFALAGFSMFLLARALTGRPSAAFVAGLAFAFAPYRFSSLGHLQVLSSFWMPLVLLGLHRYFESGRARALAGAGAALWAQSLASGYYLIYFGPFAALFAIGEMAVRGRLRDARAWFALTAAAGATAIAILPFAWPYLTLRELPAYQRELDEVARYSADLASWLTASKTHLWAWLRTFDKAEGHLFPGATITVLALVAFVMPRAGRGSGAAADVDARLIKLFSAAAVVLSMWIALGPSPTLMGEPIPILSLYRVLYDYVPGYDVSRVPSRITTITTLALALLVGLALAWFDRPRRRWAVVVAAAAILAESAMMPLPMDTVQSSAATVRPPDVLFSEAAAPPVYRFLATLPPDAVIAELPFGLPEREVQYAYYSAMHRRRIVNGYSGFFPESYLKRVRPLEHPASTFGTMYSLLKEDGVTHVVVHVDAWSDDTGRRVVKIFEGTGFRLVARFGNDFVFSLERAP